MAELKPCPMCGGSGTLIAGPVENGVCSPTIFNCHICKGQGQVKPMKLKMPPRKKC